MILGVTGNIASGKSTAARYLEGLGARRICADELARAVVAPGTKGLAQIVKRFGDEVLLPSGELDRARLGEIVFADPLAKKALEEITHPAIAALSRQRLAEAKQDNPSLIVYEAPLLFEAGAESRVDAVLVIRVDPAVQLRRLMERDGLSRKASLQRIDAQMSQEEKVRRADYVLENSGSKEQLFEGLSRLWERLRERQ